MRFQFLVIFIYPYIGVASGCQAVPELFLFIGRFNENACVIGAAMYIVSCPACIVSGTVSIFMCCSCPEGTVSVCRPATESLAIAVLSAFFTLVFFFVGFFEGAFLWIVFAESFFGGW